MAINPLSYVTNVGKSVAYSATDKFLKMNPAIEEFAEQNAELGKILYSTVKDYKKSIRNAKDYVIKSDVGQFANQYRKSLFEDLKSGNFYNKERIDKMDALATGGLTDFSDDPFSDLDGFDDMGGGNNDFDVWKDIDAGDEFLADTLDFTGEKITNGIAMATGKSAEYVVESNKGIALSSRKHNEFLANKLSIGLNAVNSSVSNLINFNDKVMISFIDNSNKFYENVTSMDKERNQLLAKIVEGQNRLYQQAEETKKNSENITFSDIVGAEGMPDLKTYFKKVGKNVSGASNGVFDMNKMFNGGNMLMSFAGAPLKFITDKAVQAFVPKMVEEASKSLNDTLSGLFGSLIMKANSKANDTDSSVIGNFLGKILGIQSTPKSSLSVGRFNRGPIPWDGESKMALTNVIPTLLSKILAAQTGKGEMMFDMQSGKWTNMAKYAKDNSAEKTTRSFADSASSELREVMENYAKMIHFDSKHQYDTLIESMKDMFYNSYSSGNMIKFNKKDVSSYDLGISDQDSANIIVGMLKAIGKSNPGLLMQYNKNVLEKIDSQNRVMQDHETNANSLNRNIYNGFNPGEFENIMKDTGEAINNLIDIQNGKNNNPALKNNIFMVRDELGHNIFWYQQRIVKELQAFREAGYGGSGYGNRYSLNGSSSSNKSIDSISIPTDSYHAVTPHSVTKSKDKQRENDYFLSTQNKRHKLKAYDKKLAPLSENTGNAAMDARNAEINRRNFYYSEPVFDVNFVDKYRDFDNSDEQSINAYTSFFLNSENEKKSMKRAKENISRQKKGKKTFAEKVMSMDSVDDRVKNMMLGLDELSSKPAEFLANIIHKTDQRLYSIVYGDENSDKLDKKSFMYNLIARMTSTFANFTDFLKDDIFNPLKESLFGDKGFTEILKEQLSKLGFDEDKMKGNLKEFLMGKIDPETGERLTDGAFGGKWDYIKRSMKDVYRVDRLKNYVKGNQLTDLQDITDERRRASYARNTLFRAVGDEFFDGMHNDLLDSREGIYGMDTKDMRGQLKKNYNKARQNYSISLGGIKSMINNGNLSAPVLYDSEGNPQKNKDGSIKYDLVAGRNLFKNIHNAYSKDEVDSQYQALVQERDAFLAKHGVSSVAELSELTNPDGTPNLKAKKEYEVKIGRKLRNMAKRIINVNGGDRTALAAMGFGNRLNSWDANGLYEKVNIDPTVQQFYKGGIVKKSGLATVSEGELIIPSSRNPFYKGNKNLAALRNEENRVKSKYNKFIDSSKYHAPIGSFATGTAAAGVEIEVDGNGNPVVIAGNASEDESSDDDGDPAHRKNKYKTRRGGRLGYERKGNGLADNIGMELNGLRAAIGSVAGERLLPRMRKSSNRIADGLDVIAKDVENAAGAQNQDELWDDMVHDVTGDFSKYIPSMVGSGLIGGGISLVTGAVGGPLLGAAVGAATDLVVRSDKVRDWLFGKEIDGERQGNILSKNLSNNITKYFPDMAKGAVVGGITSILPFVPGGPVAGVMLGSAIGFAKNNDKILTQLFGAMNEETGQRDQGGLLNKELRDKVKQNIPRMVLGGAVGAFTGPFGLVGNLALGSAIGFATSTDKFKDALFGKEDPETGKRTGGFLGAIETRVVDPLARAFDPIAKQGQLLFESIKNSFSNAIHKVTENKLGIPFERFIREGIIGKVGRGAKFAAGAVTRPAFNLATMPFQMVGKVGDALRKNQVRHGNADYMTANQRMEYRDELTNNVLYDRYGEDQFDDDGKLLHRRGDVVINADGSKKVLKDKRFRYFNKTFGRTKLKKDNFKDFDEMLVGTNKDDLKDIKTSLSFLKQPNNVLESERSASIQRLNQAINYEYGIPYKDSKKILSALTDGNFPKAMSIVSKLGLDSYTEMKLTQLMTQEYSKLQATNQIKSAGSSAKKNVFDTLKKKYGLKELDENTIGKYEKLVDQEIGEKEKYDVSNLNDDQEKRHEKVMAMLQSLSDNIRAIYDPRVRNELTKSNFKKNMYAASKKYGLGKFFDSNDSGIFGNYDYDTSIDENGHTHFYRISKDGNRQEVNEHGLPIDEEGNVIQENKLDAAQENYINNDGKHTKLQHGLNRAASWAGDKFSNMWNFKAGSWLAGKFNRKDKDTSNQSESEEKGDIRYVADSDGNPIKWRENSEGNWVVDTNDSDTRMTLAEKAKNSAAKGWGWFQEKFKDFTGDIHDGFNNLFRIDKEKDGTLKKIAKVGIGVLGALTVAGFMPILETFWDNKLKPGIHDFYTDNIYPRIEKYLEPIKPALAKGALGIDSAIRTIPRAIELLGDRIKGFINNLPNLWSTKILPFYQGGMEWISDKMEWISEKVILNTLKIAPSIIKGAVKGVWSYMRNDIFSIFGGLGRMDSKSILKSTTNFKTANGSSSLFGESSSSKSYNSVSPFSNLYKSITGETPDQTLGTSGPTSQQLKSYYEGKTESYPEGFDSSYPSNAEVNAYNNSSNTSYASSGSSALSRLSLSEQAIEAFATGEASDNSSTVSSSAMAAYDEAYNENKKSKTVTKTVPISSKSNSSSVKNAVNNITSGKSLKYYGGSSNPLASTDDGISLYNATYDPDTGLVYDANGALIENTYYDPDTDTFTNAPTESALNAFPYLSTINNTSDSSSSTSANNSANSYMESVKSWDLNSYKLSNKANVVDFLTGDGSIGSQIAKTAGKAALTGRRSVLTKGLANFAAKNINSKGILGPFKKMAGYTVKGSGAIIEKSAKADIINRTLTKVSGGVYESQAETLLKKAAIGSGDTIATKFKKKIIEFFSWISGNGTVKKYIKGTLKSEGKECTESVVKEATEKIAREATQAISEASTRAATNGTGKLAAALGKAIPFVNAAFYLADFYDGYSNAASYMGITDDSCATWQRLVCGLAALVNGVLTLGLIPMSTIIQLFTNIIMPIFGFDMEDFNKLKEEAGRELAAYNELNGTNLNMQQYNERDEFGARTWNKVKGFFGGTDIYKNANKEIDKSKSSVSSYTSNMSYSTTPIVQTAKSYSFLGGSGSGIARLRYNAKVAQNNAILVSQLNPLWSNDPYNTSQDTIKQTIGTSGCGPAVATMAINQMVKGSPMTIQKAAKFALTNNDKEKDLGTNVRYFKDIYSNNGLGTKYIESGYEMKKVIASGSPVVLLGQDDNNNSKKYSPFGTNDHYVVTNGFSSDGKYVYVNDPEQYSENVAYPVNKILGKTKLAIAPTSNIADRNLEVPNKYKGYSAMGSGIRSSSTRRSRNPSWLSAMGSGLRKYSARGNEYDGVSVDVGRSNNILNEIILAVMISSQSRSYTSVIWANSKGYSQLGIMQWQQKDAANLLYKIYTKNKKAVKEILGEGTNIYKDVINKRSLQGKKLSSGSRNKIINLLNSTEGREIQIDKAKTDASSRVKAVGARYSDPKVIIFVSALYYANRDAYRLLMNANQSDIHKLSSLDPLYSYFISNVSDYATKATTYDALYKFAATTPCSSNNTNNFNKDLLITLISAESIDSGKENDWLSSLFSLFVTAGKAMFGIYTDSNATASNNIIDGDLETIAAMQASNSDTEIDNKLSKYDNIINSDAYTLSKRQNALSTMMNIDAKRALAKFESSSFYTYLVVYNAFQDYEKITVNQNITYETAKKKLSLITSSSFKQDILKEMKNTLNNKYNFNKSEDISNYTTFRNLYYTFVDYFIAIGEASDLSNISIKNNKVVATNGEVISNIKLKGAFNNEFFRYRLLETLSFTSGLLKNEKRSTIVKYLKSYSDGDNCKLLIDYNNGSFLRSIEVDKQKLVDKIAIINGTYPLKDKEKAWAEAEAILVDTFIKERRYTKNEIARLLVLVGGSKAFAYLTTAEGYKAAFDGKPISPLTVSGSNLMSGSLFKDYSKAANVAVSKSKDYNSYNVRNPFTLKRMIEDDSYAKYASAGQKATPYSASYNYFNSLAKMRWLFKTNQGAQNDSILMNALKTGTREDPIEVMSKYGIKFPITPYRDTSVDKYVAETLLPAKVALANEHFNGKSYLIGSEINRLKYYDTNNGTHLYDDFIKYYNIFKSRPSNLGKSAFINNQRFNKYEWFDWVNKYTAYKNNGASDSILEPIGKMKTIQEYMAQEILGDTTKYYASGDSTSPVYQYLTGSELQQYLDANKARYTNYSTTAYNGTTTATDAAKYANSNLGNLASVISKYSPSGKNNSTKSNTSLSVITPGTKNTISANGSGFVSQLDYADKKFSDGDSLAKSGCGPAVAAMALNNMSGSGTMETAAAIADQYKNPGGTSADYFQDIFGRAGVGTEYYDGADKKSNITNSLKSGEQVVLMGRDPSNTSKENSPFGPNNHYVLATGLGNGKVQVNDPEQGAPAVYDDKILNKTQLGIAVGAGSGINFTKYARYNGAGAFTGSNAILAAIIVTASVETGINFGGVNWNDNGGMSVGIMQWHKGRAYRLLKSIISAHPSAQSIFMSSGAANLYSRLMSASDSSIINITNKNEEAAVKALLTSAQGKQIQLELLSKEFFQSIASTYSKFVDVKVRVLLNDYAWNMGSGNASKLINSYFKNNYNIGYEEAYKLMCKRSSASAKVKRWTTVRNFLSSIAYLTVPASAPTADEIAAVLGTDMASSSFSNGTSSSASNDLSSSASNDLSSLESTIVDSIPTNKEASSQQLSWLDQLSTSFINAGKAMFGISSDSSSSLSSSSSSTSSRKSKTVGSLDILPDGPVKVTYINALGSGLKLSAKGSNIKASGSGLKLSAKGSNIKQNTGSRRIINRTLGISGGDSWLNQLATGLTNAGRAYFGNEITNTSSSSLSSSYSYNTNANNISYSYDVNSNTSSLTDIINMNDAQRWLLITGGKCSTYTDACRLSEKECTALMTTITIKTWDGSSTVNKTLSINKYLASFWQSFFNDIYNLSIKFNIKQIYGFSYRKKTGGSGMSSHSFGTAVDINWNYPRMGWKQAPYSYAEWSKLPASQKKVCIGIGTPVARLASTYKLDWGGSWNSNKDPMHFSFVGDCSRQTVNSRINSGVYTASGSGVKSVSSVSDRAMKELIFDEPTKYNGGEGEGSGMNNTRRVSTSDVLNSVSANGSNIDTITISPKKSDSTEDLLIMVVKLLKNISNNTENSKVLVKLLSELVANSKESKSTSTTSSSKKSGKGSGATATSVTANSYSNKDIANVLSKHSQSESSDMSSLINDLMRMTQK